MVNFQVPGQRFPFTGKSLSFFRAQVHIKLAEKVLKNEEENHWHS